MNPEILSVVQRCRSRDLRGECSHILFILAAVDVGKRDQLLDRRILGAFASEFNVDQELVLLGSFRACIVASLDPECYVVDLADGGVDRLAKTIGLAEFRASKPESLDTALDSRDVN